MAPLHVMACRGRTAPFGGRALAAVAACATGTAPQDPIIPDKPRSTGPTQEFLPQHPASDSDGSKSEDKDEELQHARTEESEIAKAVSMALLQAVRLNDIDKVHRLLEAGCDVDVQDGDGQTPLHIAASGEPLSFNLAIQ